MFNVNDIVHHNGEDGRFIVKSIRKDGDIDCFGGLGYVPGERNIKCHAQWRTFRQEDCRLAKVKRKLRTEDYA